MASTIPRADSCACARDDLQQPRDAELVQFAILRLEHAVRAEHEHVAGRQIERHLVVGRPGKRAERHARQLNLGRLPAADSGSDTAGPELAIVTVRRLKSKTA